MFNELDDMNRYCYWLLNENEQKIYTQINDGITNLSSFIRTDVTSKDNLSSIIRSVLTDHPQYFWFEGRVSAAKEKGCIVVMPQYLYDFAEIKTVKRQIETLKMQNNHAGKLYAERLGKAKMEYHYKLQIAETKAQVIKERLEDKVKALTKRVDEEQEAKEVLQKENEKLRKNTGWFSKWRMQETKVESEKKPEKVKEEETVNDPTADERRELCIQILGNEKFTGEQIDLIIPALEDESIPLGTLKILCRPDLPVQNMKGLIRFIKGGKKDHEKQGS